MKKMTKQQIEEINKLLVDHGESLTALYDEGLKNGFKNAMTGFIIGQATVLGISIIVGGRTILKNKIETRKIKKQIDELNEKKKRIEELKEE